MARINVEQRAIKDPRFKILGDILGATHQHALGCMIEVWNECQERESYRLTGDVLDAILCVTESGMKLVRSQLAVVSKRGGFRIKGTRGRTDWLKKRRQDGKKGGRPKKTLRLTLGFDEKHPTDNPPAPAPAPAPAQVLSEKDILSNPPQTADVDAPRRAAPRKRNGADPATLEHFAAFWDDYPRREAKQAALKAFTKVNPDIPTLHAIGEDIEARIEAGTWQPDDPERLKFIPLPASYLNGRRWEDGSV